MYERFLVSSTIPETWGGRTPFSSLYCNVNVGVDLTKKESFEMKTEGRLSSKTSICMYLSYMYFHVCIVYWWVFYPYIIHPNEEIPNKWTFNASINPSSLEKHGRRGSSWWMSADVVRRRLVGRAEKLSWWTIPYPQKAPTCCIINYCIVCILHLHIYMMVEWNITLRVSWDCT